MPKRSLPRAPRSAPHFTVATLPFIQKAGRQKSAEWLERHRDEYLEQVVGPLQSIAQHLRAELGKLARDYHFPMRGLGRLKRSAHSADRYGAPLRDYVSYTARRPAASRFDHPPSIFLLVYPADEDGDEVLLSGGMYQPSSRQLKSVREAIAANAEPFEKLFRDPDFRASFPQGFSDERKSKRPPRGFDPEHPHVEWLKHQAYFVWKSYRPKQYTAPTFGDRLVKDARQILRLNALLELAIEGRWPTEPKLRREKRPALLDRLEDSALTAPREMDF